MSTKTRNFCGSCGWLLGEADINRDDNIAKGEIKAWLNDQAPYMARRLTGNEQQPVIMRQDNDELVVLRR